MKERPILFSGPMVRALLNDRKTQTRRAMNPQPTMKGEWYSLPKLSCSCEAGFRHSAAIFESKFGQPGDRLWVREAWARTKVAQAAGQEWVVYREGDNRTDYGGPWKPSIHMFRKDSRITLEIVSVRVERLQEIGEADALAEGCTRNHNSYYWGGPHATGGQKQMATAVGAYRDLWESINGPGSWDANPWVWVVEFKKVAA